MLDFALHFFAGIGIGYLLWVLADVLRPRLRLCERRYCCRRATHALRIEWPPVRVRLEIDGHVLEGTAPDPDPFIRGRYCWRHATAEAAHWSVEFARPRLDVPEWVTEGRHPVAGVVALVPNEEERR